MSSEENSHNYYTSQIVYMYIKLMIVPKFHKHTDAGN